MPNPQNTLYYGDNLNVLRDYVADASVDLIYLDPPFNSSRSYNVLFRDESGKEGDAQITAFEDTWHWNQKAEAQYSELVRLANEPVSKMIEAMRQFIGANQMMAYLVMMAARLVELHRVLKPTGSIYLHCDPTASHYLKVVMDTVFGAENFRNEIVWKRTSSHNDARRQFGDVSDTILFYTKGRNYIFAPQYGAYSEKYLTDFYRHVDDKGRRYRLSDLRSPNPRPNLMYDYKGYKPHPNGWAVSRAKMEALDVEGKLHFPKKADGRIQLKRFLDERAGMPVTTVWDDIPPIGAQAAERLGYPTQKPVALLERIISASSNPGDLVLDPFAGCGTTIDAAQKLGRRWIGIDITHLSIALLKYRLENTHGLVAGKEYAIVGEPVDYSGAAQLALDDRYQFQWWALSLIRAKPQGGSAGSKQGKKGADSGIDGVIVFEDEPGGKANRALVQVKSGHVNAGTIRDLIGAVNNEKAAIGILITLEEPSQPMKSAAAAAGFYRSPGWNQEYPRIQILTVGDLLSGRAEAKHPSTNISFKQAARAQGDALQPGLGLGQ